MEAIRSQGREFYVSSIPDEGRKAEDGGGKNEEKPGTLFVARLDVVLKTDPFEQESVKTMRLIQTWLESERPRTGIVACDVHSECFGITANAHDLAQLTESDRQRVNLVVLAAIFVILLLLVAVSGWPAIFW